jgi:PAS domain S-box-containing protein
MTTQPAETSANLPGILIVEDSPVATELLRRTLLRAGYAVNGAKDGEEGLQAARALRPALVLSDINMPVMNGYQLCRAIKFDDDLWNIPVILLTVLSETEDIIKAINSGADAYIVKPFVEANLLERIHSLLDAPIERRRAEERRVEVMCYNGQRHTIAGGGQQILNLLFSLYENSLNQNRELTIIQAQLNLLNEGLDAQVRERTADLARINRALRTLSVGNHALVRATSEEELLRDAVHNIAENGGYCLATITYIGDDQEKSLTLMASAGAGEDIFPAQELLTMGDANEIQAPIVRAIHSGQMQVCHDIATDPGFTPWKETALARGYASNIALPLANGGGIFGGLSIFSSEANTFDAEEAALLEELAGDIAYGIVNLRARAALHTAELALRESEERHRLLFENSHDALMTLAPPSWKFTSANKATLKMFGAASIAEFTALGPWDISPERQPDGCTSAEKAQEMIAIALRNGSNFFEWEHQGLDGTPFAVDVLLTLIEQGGKTSLQATVRDITERKRAENLLHESELRYRRLFEAAKDGILILDAETGKIIDANPFILNLLSYSLSECSGKMLWEIGLLGDIESSKVAFQELQTKEYLRYEDLPLKTKDGRQIDVEFISNLYKVGNRKVIQCNIRDISEHKQAEKALRDSEARYKRITEGLTDYQYTVRIENGRAVETWQSPACVTVTGYTAEEFSANPHLWIQMVVPKDRELVKQRVSQILAGKDVPHMEHCIIRKDGASRWVSDTTILFKDAAGKLLSYDGVIKDITERKSAEDALRRANRALKTLSEGNLALVRAASEEELLRTVTNVIVKNGGYLLAEVGYAENDPEKSITPMAWSDINESHCWLEHSVWTDTEQDQLPIARAIRSGTTQIYHDIANDPGCRLWRDAALTRGYASNIALPLTNGGKIFGGLSIYSSELDAFDEEEVRLLEELANDLAYGIFTLRTRAEHEQHAKILRQSLEQSIQTIAGTVEARDPYTAGHQRRVGELATAIAREMSLPEEQVHGIHLAAMIHDLGKIHIPAEILSKPGKLNAIEFMLIKMHPQSGYDILKNVKFPWPIANIILQHHERLDGSGYPQGLKGDQILLESQIMTVADVVEAMSSHRPYRSALGIEAALSEIKRGRGSVYDPVIVDVCLMLFGKKGFTFSDQ